MLEPTYRHIVTIAENRIAAEHNAIGPGGDSTRSGPHILNRPTDLQIDRVPDQQRRRRDIGHR